MSVKELIGWLQSAAGRRSVGNKGTPDGKLLLMEEELARAKQCDIVPEQQVVRGLWNATNGSDHHLSQLYLQNA
jgi:hypothetical protein